MNDSKDLKQRMASLSDEELLRMVTEDAADYRRDALDFAKAELRSRGVDYSTPPPAEGTTVDDPSEGGDSLALHRRNGCPSCGGLLRAATLTGEREVTVVFSDNKEERFVLVSVCSQCGLVSLAVDLEAEVGR
jgi:hypothetical protein